ncbi:hypothetical protein IJ843_01445, partial [bacterium]|nr:hypothetical protein [bacterium]
FDRILEFLKTSKKCDSVTSCSIELSENVSSATYSTAAVLADGTTIGWRCSLSNSVIGICTIDVDIDGVQRGKNRYGYDVFSFFLNNEKGISTGYASGDYIFPISDADHVYGGVGSDYFSPDKAAAWIISFENMDYLKTKGKDGTTCPDGKTKLTFGGNHTCK